MNHTLPFESAASPTRLPDYRAAARALATRIVQAAAGGAVLAAAPAAHADIIYSGPLNATAADAFTGVYFDPDDFIASSGPFPNWVFNPFFQGSNKMYSNVVNPDRGWTSAALAYGTPVQTASFTNDTPILSGTGTAPTYIGIRFTGDDAQLHYGWIEVSWASPSHLATIHSAAYNSTPSGAINAGQTVPEASHAALLLGAGAAGLLLLRKRQQSLRPAA